MKSLVFTLFLSFISASVFGGTNSSVSKTEYIEKEKPACFLWVQRAVYNADKLSQDNPLLLVVSGNLVDYDKVQLQRDSSGALVSNFRGLKVSVLEKSPSEFEMTFDNQGQLHSQKVFATSDNNKFVSELYSAEAEWVQLQDDKPSLLDSSDVAYFTKYKTGPNYALDMNISCALRLEPIQSN